MTLITIIGCWTVVGFLWLAFSEGDERVWYEWVFMLPVVVLVIVGGAIFVLIKAIAQACALYVGNKKIIDKLED